MTGATDDLETRLVGIANDACLALMLSVGHRTGLLDALAASGPTTVDELATVAGCAPRYVREWSGALVAGGLMTWDDGTIALVPGAADLLTRSAPANLAATMQYIGVLGSAEDGIVDCFRRGGGLGYEHFPRFHEVMAEESAATVVAQLDEAILPLVPGLQERLRHGIDVLDVGCGQGRALITLARRYPASRFVGVDLNAVAVDRARQDSADLPNATFRLQDATTLAEDLPAASVDLALTFDAIHDQGRPDLMLAGIRQVLRPDGVYLAQDIAGSGDPGTDRDLPLGPLLYTISAMHCLTVSLAADGLGLGAMWGTPAARQFLADAGFGSVEVYELPHDVQNAYYVCRP